MKTLFTLWAAVFSLLISTSAAISFGGDDWNALTKGEKITFTTGFFAGAKYEAKVWDLSLALADPKFTPALAHYAAGIEDIANQHNSREMRNVTAQQIADGLDTIYADYRNRRIEVDDATTVVLRSLDGTPDPEIEKLLEEKRKAVGN
jgi:hypothetical protein